MTEVQLHFFDEEQEPQEQPDQKYCKMCELVLPVDYFSDSRTIPYCKECTKVYMSTLNFLKKKHPIPQDHRCEICNRSESEIPYQRKTPWRLDHCHKTNKFRGYLCSACNSALGMFFDDPKRLEAAIEYLKRNEEIRE